ncbi:MAG TPA: HEAT repeat domain-containing protein [Bacteroidetes bacterium]|nr:HEAT repeat domain-containing protein [Bacteroidota bacterium]
MKTEETKSKINIEKENIRSLFFDLGGENGLNRQEARKVFVSRGTDAVDYLAEAIIIANHNEKLANFGVSPGHLKWEALKALVEIANPSSTPLFLDAMKDEDNSIRWLAAEGFSALQNDGLKYLLDALIKSPDSLFLRRGAHHVLSTFIQLRKIPGMRELLNELKNPVEDERIPLSAKKVLEAITNFP